MPAGPPADAASCLPRGWAEGAGQRPLDQRLARHRASPSESPEGQRLESPEGQRVESPEGQRVESPEEQRTLRLQELEAWEMHEGDLMGPDGT